MEDKRTLLAFLFIGLILLLMPYYFDLVGVSPEPPIENQGNEQEEVVKSNPEPQQVEPSPIPTPTPVQTPAPESEVQAPPSDLLASEAQEIVVTTPLQRFVFSSLGGALTSAQLLSYTSGEEDQYVELVPPHGRGLVLQTKLGDQITDFSQVEFSPDRLSLDLGAGEDRVLLLRADLDQGKFIEKAFTFSADKYAVRLKVRLAGFDPDTQVLLTSDKGISISEPNPMTDLTEMRVMTFVNEELFEIRLDDEEEERVEQIGSVKWGGVRSKYFLSALAFLDQGRYRSEILRLEGGSEQPSRFSFSVGGKLNDNGELNLLAYWGPLEYEELSSYEVFLDKALDLGWPIISDISKVLLYLFVLAYSFVPNYGFVIILFAIVVKLLLYPLTHKTYESAARMQEIQPKIAALRDKYKNDAQRLSRETMKLYKDEGVNPLGGCLPLLPQMPIFFAIYRVFSEAIQMRQAPFIWWIQDLSQPDEIFVADFGIRILPILMALFMFFQQKMTMKDPKQAALVYFMPIFMVFIFWGFSSGLVLYWTVFNLLSIAQQYLINYIQNKPKAQTVTVSR